MVTVDELKSAIDELEQGKKGAKKMPAKKEAPMKTIKLTKKERDAQEDLDLPGSEVFLLGHYEGKLMNEYSLEREKIPVTIRIVKPGDTYTPIYDIYMPAIGEGTRLVLEKVRAEVTKAVGLSGRDVLDVKLQKQVEERFRENAFLKLKEYLPGVSERNKEILSEYLINDMLGLGKMDVLISDDALEEIVVNSAHEPVWVYHKMHGWLKTNMMLRDDAQVADYANSIGRRAERQINTLNPLMDAHLTTGERVNATLMPVSTHGNTITIRKFSRDPWTITDFISNNTMDPAIAAFVWTAMQYEMNMIVAGGTASGKTSMLNSLSPFLPPNHRIISIEDTRELRLPSYLHWVPMVTRQPNAEKQGGVSMLDLMVNSLRMRPDRIIVGEIRKQAEAEVLFEAMHTGHSVYSTLHANTADEVRRRLVTAPLNIPETLLESLHLVMVQFRHRKRGIRRTLELAEVVPTADGSVSLRNLYKWRPAQDSFGQIKDSVRIIPEIQMFSGLSAREVEEELRQKEEIVKWIVKNQVKNTDDIGLIVGEYYINEERVANAVKKNVKPLELIRK